MRVADDRPRPYAGAALLALALALAAPAPPAHAAPSCEGRTATLVGTRGDDSLTGTGADDVIVALGGTDEVDGRGGDDVVCGGSGADRLVGGRGSDRLHGGSGGDGDDTGTAAPDRLVGGPGDDLLDGRVGDRELVLGVRDVLDYSEARQGIAVDLDAGTVTGLGDDRIVGRHVLLLATVHDDVVVGSVEPDSMFLGRGADLVRAGPGGDEVFTGPGRDELHGGAGPDSLFAGAGADVVRAGSGDDRVKDSGPTAADDLAGGGGDDSITDRFVAVDGQRYTGGPGEGDLLTLEPGFDGEYDGSWDLAGGTLAMAGEPPFDAEASDVEWADLPAGVGFEVTGTDADERVFAHGPYVRFFAEAGDDVLVGTDGDDVFDGGPGIDSTPFIGDGDDTCVSVEEFTEGARRADCETRRTG